MRRIALAVGLTFAMAGCTVPPASNAAAPPPSPGRIALSAIATPFFLILKLPACAITMALGGPLAGSSQLAGNAQTIEIDDAVSDALERNCGPPYAVMP